MSNKPNMLGPKSLTMPLQKKLSRRQLIQTSFFGTAILSISSGAAALSENTETLDQPTQLNGYSYAFLNKDDLILITALLPAVIGLHWPIDTKHQKEANEKTLKSIDLYISRLGAFNTSEIRKLFDLLNFRMTRFLIAGIWSNWDTITPKQVDDFLNSWKHSRFSLLIGGYNALSDILAFCWYSNPENTSKLGYSGPPDFVLEALPQFKAQSKQAT